jgi:membrane-associated protease RseP (regulator of RpoE activity)
MEIGVRMPQTGRLGIQFSCGECGPLENPTTGESLWFFSGPLEVTGVTPGGPAEGAGIQIGDLIKAINGHLMETEEGGSAFTRLRAGERATLTVVKRNGSEVEVGLVPEARVVVGVAAPPPEPAAVAVGVRPAPPRPPKDVEVAEPAVSAGAETGMPLRYSGMVQGVEIEVRGNPVTVSKLEGARTVYINADGLWIRITVPPSGGAGGGNGEN